MPYNLVTPRIGAQAIGTTDSVQNHVLGTVVTAKDATLGEGDFIYVQVSNSVTQFDAVAIKAGYKAAPLTLTNGQLAVEVGFAQVANNTKDTYMWVQKSGRIVQRLAAACEPSVKLYATATGGVLDDATTSCLIGGLYATTSATNTAVTAGVTCVSRYPVVLRNPAT